jgi:hypothetical protein
VGWPGGFWMLPSLFFTFLPSASRTTAFVRTPLIRTSRRFSVFSFSLDSGQPPRVFVSKYQFCIVKINSCASVFLPFDFHTISSSFFPPFFD